MDRQVKNNISCPETGDKKIHQVPVKWFNTKVFPHIVSN